VVTIYVGEENKCYVVHKALLTGASDYFEKALNGSFKEAEEETIFLPEENANTFDLLIGFLYQGMIPAISPPFGKSVVQRTHVPVHASSIASRSGEGESPLIAYQRLVAPLYPDGTYPVHVSERDMATVSAAPVNRGTVHTPFVTTVGQGQPRGIGMQFFEHHNTISAQPEYKDWSVEELRAADYRNGLTSDLATNTVNDLAASLATTSLSLTIPEARLWNNLVLTGRLPNIPRCPTLAAHMASEETLQLALLNLCLLAETLCWDTLFNAGITAYTTGESVLCTRRALPASHIQLIYSRAHEASPCRAFAACAAAIAVLHDKSTHGSYIAITPPSICPGFLEDWLTALADNESARIRGEDVSRVVLTDACQWHVHRDGKRCGDVRERAREGNGRREVGVFGRGPFAT
jgi:hypothetical protein